MKTNAGDIAARLGGTLHGDPATPIHGVGTLQDGQAGEIGITKIGRASCRERV